MLDGKPVVFLSCSEKFKKEVAEPVRDGLAACRLRAIIVSNEPLLPRVGWEPDDKVQSYLTASDAMVAICTPDDLLDNNTVQTRPNIIDEIGRARSLPHLRDKIMVLKAPEVQLPSNINPTYDQLDPGLPLASLPAIVQQLQAWGVVPEASPIPAELPRDAPIDVSALLNGIDIGDHDKASTLAYEVSLGKTREGLLQIVGELAANIRIAAEAAEDTQVHIAGTVLTAFARIDHGLVPMELIEEFAASRNMVAVRMIAMFLLEDLAAEAPSEVPLGLIGRLALPATEDWYVQAPALAVAKALMLRRRDARMIVDGLSKSDSVDNRYAAAKALLDVARVDPLAPPREAAERLAVDADPLVSQKALEALQVMGPWDEQAYWKRWRTFDI